MEELSENQARIWDVLQNRKGRDKALTARQLARLTSINEREVRAIISGLRRDGYPIASVVHPPYGFFVPVNREESDECLAHIYSRVREMLLTADPLEKSFGRYVPGRQMVLDLFGGKGESA